MLFYVTLMMPNQLTLTVTYKIPGQPWLLYVTGNNHTGITSTFNDFFLLVLSKLMVLSFPC